MGDRLIRGHFPQHGIRFAVCQAAETCTEAVQRHQADWLAAWLLSEALTCASLLSVMLKATEKYTLRWMYPGPVGTILADTDEHGEVRGFPQRLRLLEEVTTLAEAMGGEGRITATTSLPNRVLHTGITPGVFRDVPRDMAHLLSLSFQVESAMCVGLIMPPAEPVTVQSALGVLLQPLPGADLERFEAVRAAVEQPDFRAWLEEAPRAPETVLERVGPAGDTPQVLQESTPRFRCHCSREKVASVLRMFDPAELQDMLESEGQADVNCHFCAATYHFSRSDLETMLGQSQIGHA
ncbi:MAG TPA: Hsp33 family molecular chaperone HslO [bacterium]|nr:Hsp33 family molecular chaperone HslO [bacterium]